MNRDYWENVADSYDTEIFSVLEHDADQLIGRRIERFGHPEASAADLGCGVGHFIPLLAENFGQVLACDLSAQCLDQARERYADLASVDYEQVDLAGRPNFRTGFDFALCINVLITDDLAVRARALRNLSGYLREGGHLVLVVPSLESALLTSARIIQWNLRDGHAPSEAARLGLPRHGSIRQLHRGNLPIDGVPTKHYLREELEFLLPDHGFEIEEVEKIPYSWSTEFDAPPAWMQEPHPWDWMVVARRE